MGIEGAEDTGARLLACIVTIIRTCNTIITSISFLILSNLIFPRASFVILSASYSDEIKK
jgi:hypothetical protein